ncbi:MAG TPA: cytochrome c oxidase assembly protein [Pseudonocardiaceae bacterium]|nr:cytochrome c oxidase assembly protein [Pseudonocardiaceae bacterium]
MTTPLTLTETLTGWTFDIPAVVFVLLVGGLYLAGVRRFPEAWPRSRTTSFGIGLALILLVTCSFLGGYADILFWARAAQVITLLMLAPLCLAMGSPVALALGSLPERGQDRLRRAMAGRFARVLTYPATASLLLVALPWALYFTPWYPAVLDNAALDQVTRLVLLLAGFTYFYSRLQLDPVPHHYPHLISVMITFVEVIFDAALGLVLWLSPHLVAQGHYQALHRSWGPSLRTDQIIGAGVLWLVGDVAGLPFLGALMSRMAKDDAREAAEIDQRLDEEELAAAADAPDSDEPAAPARLWWENDPQLAERFRRR